MAERTDRTRGDTKGQQMGHYSVVDGTPFCPMGHYFAMMGHQMGHQSAMMGQQMGHQSAKMGHEGTSTDTILTSAGVMVKRKAGRGSSTRFPGAERPKNRGKVASRKSQKRTRSRFAIIAGCGILLPTSFQASKGGDMVCARGPLDTLCQVPRHPMRRRKRRGASR
jgi:hypothetical protein